MIIIPQINNTIPSIKDVPLKDNLKVLISKYRILAIDNPKTTKWLSWGYLFRQKNIMTDIIIISLGSWGAS